MARRKAEQDETLYECVEPHVAGVDGEEYAFKLGDRVEGHHPARRKNPMYFAPFGSSVGRPRHLGTNLAVEADEPEPPPKPKRMVKAKRNLRVEGVVMPGGWAPGLTVINAGDLYPHDHPVVQANKRDFEKVKL